MSKTQAKVDVNVRITCHMEAEDREGMDPIGEHIRIGFSEFNKKKFHEAVHSILANWYTDIKIADKGFQDNSRVDYDVTAIENATKEKVHGIASLEIEEDVLTAIKDAATANYPEGQTVNNSGKGVAEGPSSDDGDGSPKSGDTVYFMGNEYKVDKYKGGTVFLKSLNGSLVELATNSSQWSNIVDGWQNNWGESEAETHNELHGFYDTTKRALDLNDKEATKLFAEAEKILAKKLGVSEQIAGAILDFKDGRYLAEEMTYLVDSKSSMKDLVAACDKATDKILKNLQKLVKNNMEDLEEYVSAVASYMAEAKVYTPEQQELFSKVSNTFNRLNMGGQGDTSETVNFKNGQLKILKKDGKVMLEYKGAMLPLENPAALEEHLEENLDYYMNKINKGYQAEASRHFNKEELASLKELKKELDKLERKDKIISDLNIGRSPKVTEKLSAEAETINLRIKEINKKIDDMHIAISKFGDVKGQEPAEKDIQRIKDLKDKAKGDEAKMLKLAQNMANTLGVSPDSVDKAVRRAKACEMVYPGPLGKKLAKVFMDIAVNQKAAASSEVKVWFKKDEGSKWELFDGTITDDLIVEKHIKGKHLKEENNWFDVWVTNNVNEVLKANEATGQVSLADNSISKETLEVIKKDAELKSLIKDLAKAGKEVDKIRPVIDDLYNKILNKYEIIDGRSGKKITDHELTYKANPESQEELQKFYKECNDEALKLYPNTKKEHCPALTAEHKVISLENQIIEKLEAYYPFLKDRYLSSDLRKELLSIHKKLFA